MTSPLIGSSVGKSICWRNVILLLFDFGDCSCCIRRALGWADELATPKQQIAIIINNLFIRFAFTDYLGYSPHLYLHGSWQCSCHTIGTDRMYFCDIEPAATARATELLPHPIGELTVW